jgi:HipA-like protein
MNPELEKVKSLAVDLHGRRVGIINRLGGDRHLFAFEQDYIDDANRPTLSLSFKGQTGGLVTALRPVGRRIPPFFSNLLPEGHLRTYLAEKAGVKPEREFFLMAILGADVAGAVTIRPLDGEGHDIDHESHNDDHADDEPQQKGVLRFSLAGVQLKFSAVMEASGGLTIPAHGVGGSWIVKLPSAQFATVPENEFVMLELARAVGLQVPSPTSGGCRRMQPAGTVARWPWNDSIAPGVIGASTWRILRRCSVCSPRTNMAIVVMPISPRCSGPRPVTQTHMNSHAASSSLLGADRQCRHAPQELVATVPGRPHASLVPGV